MHILIVYGTVEGQTRKIAHHISDLVQNNGHRTELIDCTVSDRPVDIAPVDAILAFSSVHAGSLTKPFFHFIKQNHAALMSRPGFLGVVSLAAVTAIENEMASLDAMAADFSEDTGWWPIVIEHIAGALKYTEYDFFKKWIMKRIAEKHGGNTDTNSDTEYTEWAKLDKAVLKFLDDVPNLQNKI